MPNSNGLIINTLYMDLSQGTMVCVCDVQYASENYYKVWLNSSIFFCTPHSLCLLQTTQKAILDFWCSWVDRHLNLMKGKN